MEEDDNSVTMVDVLKEQEDFEENAKAVLGASDDKNCTYTMGYVKRQALYACLTCCPESGTDPSCRAGVCLACSLACHESHTLIELYTKRNFRCDCGGPKFKSKPCTFTAQKPESNIQNLYNQNFSGLYCTCHRPYPDPDDTVEDEMIQCVVCEDWFHSRHLDNKLPPPDQYSEMVCQMCMDKNEFLDNYLCYEVSIDKEAELDSSVDLNVTDINESVQTVHNETIESSSGNILPQQDETSSTEHQAPSINGITSTDKDNLIDTSSDTSPLENVPAEASVTPAPENNLSEETPDCSSTELENKLSSISEANVESKTLLDVNSSDIKPNEVIDNGGEIQTEIEKPMEVIDNGGEIQTETEKSMEVIDNGGEIQTETEKPMEVIENRGEIQTETENPMEVDDATNATEEQSPLKTVNINDESSLQSEKGDNESTNSGELIQDVEMPNNDKTSESDENIATPVTVNPTDEANVLQTEDVDMEKDSITESSPKIESDLPNENFENLNVISSEQDAAKSIADNNQLEGACLTNDNIEELNMTGNITNEVISPDVKNTEAENKDSIGATVPLLNSFSANDATENITPNTENNPDEIVVISEPLKSDNELNLPQTEDVDVVKDITSETETAVNLPEKDITDTSENLSKNIDNHDDPKVCSEDSKTILTPTDEDISSITKNDTESLPISSGNDINETAEPDKITNNDATSLANITPTTESIAEGQVEDSGKSESIATENLEQDAEKSQAVVAEKSETDVVEKLELIVPEKLESESKPTENSEPNVTVNSQPNITEGTGLNVIESSEPNVKESSEPVTERSECVAESLESNISVENSKQNIDNLEPSIAENAVLDGLPTPPVASEENNSIHTNGEQENIIEKMDESLEQTPIVNSESHSDNVVTSTIENNCNNVAKSTSELSTNNDDSLNDNESNDNKKRKYESHDTSPEGILKKIKKEVQVCTMPAVCQRVRRKGAVFWPSDWRSKLCSCPPCLDLYTEKKVLFLLDVEDTVSAYEDLGKIKTETSSQYEKGMEALSSLGHVQQINAITEYNKMKEKLLDFLKTFKDKKEVVKEEDIKGFFAGMKPKREPDGVYFCQ